MQQRPDVVVVVPEEMLESAKLTRYVCLGTLILQVVVVVILVILVVRRRGRIFKQ